MSVSRQRRKKKSKGKKTKYPEFPSDPSTSSINITDPPKESGSCTDATEEVDTSGQFTAEMEMADGLFTPKKEHVRHSRENLESKEVLRFEGVTKSKILDCEVHLTLSSTSPSEGQPAQVVQNLLSVQIQASASKRASLNLDSIQSKVSSDIGNNRRITQKWTVAVTITLIQLSPQSLVTLRVTSNQPKDSQSELAVTTANGSLVGFLPSEGIEQIVILSPMYNRSGFLPN